MIVSNIQKPCEGNSLKHTKTTVCQGNSFNVHKNNVKVTISSVEKLGQSNSNLQRYVKVSVNKIR